MRTGLSLLPLRRERSRSLLEPPGLGDLKDPKEALAEGPEFLTYSQGGMAPPKGLRTSRGPSCRQSMGTVQGGPLSLFSITQVSTDRGREEVRRGSVAQRHFAFSLSYLRAVYILFEALPLE